jgi:hypothetical protein
VDGGATQALGVGKRTKVWGERKTEGVFVRPGRLAGSESGQKYGEKEKLKGFLSAPGGSWGRKADKSMGRKKN